MYRASVEPKGKPNHLGFVVCVDYTIFFYYDYFQVLGTEPTSLQNNGKSGNIEPIFFIHFYFEAIFYIPF